MLQRFGLVAGANVLDVGCGEGTVTVSIAERVYPGCVTGLNRDPDLLTAALESAAKTSNATVKFVEGDATSPDVFQPNSFDFVYCRLVLWTIPEREQVVRNMIRWAKPNGIICGQEPDAMGGIYWPPHSAHDEYWNGVIKYHQDRQDGIDPGCGRKLYALFYQLGLTEIRVGVSALYKESLTWPDSAKNYKGPELEAVKAGYIPESALKGMSEWAQSLLAFMMIPTIIVAGRKAR